MRRQILAVWLVGLAGLGACGADSDESPAEPGANNEPELCTTDLMTRLEPESGTRLVGFESVSDVLGVHSLDIAQCTFFSDGREPVIEVAMHSDVDAFHDDAKAGFVTPVSGLGDEAFYRDPGDLSALIDGVVYEVFFLPAIEVPDEDLIAILRRIVDIVASYATSGSSGAGGNACDQLVTHSQRLESVLAAYNDALRDPSLVVSEVPGRTQAAIEELEAALTAASEQQVGGQATSEQAQTLLDAATDAVSSMTAASLEEAKQLMAQAVAIVSAESASCVGGSSSD